MTKTLETQKIEKALILKTSQTKGCYGALEVTLDYCYGRSGYQRCDYVQITNDCQITCYEIKVSWADLNSDNLLTYEGHRNYLVVPSDLAKKIINEHYFLGSTGLMELTKDGKLRTIKSCRHHSVSFERVAAITNAVMKAACRDFAKYYLAETD